MPVKALTEGGGDTTSGGGGGLPLFGLPNIELPPPPEGTAASGVGTGPPPGPVQNIDMSINYNDSTIGEDRVFAMPFSCVRRLCAACAADDS